MISRTFFAFLCSGAAAVVASDSVEANDLTSGNRALSRADAQCAAYGPGFTAVDGSDSCVWVGGHVRLEVGSRMASAPDNGWAAAPGTVRVNNVYEQSDGVATHSARSETAKSRERLRLPESDITGSIDPFR